MANRKQMGCPHVPGPCPSDNNYEECHRCQDRYDARRTAELAPRIRDAIELLEDHGYVVGLELPQPE